MAVWSSEELFYCSNVHPGDSLREVENNVRRFISPVRSQRGLEQLQAGLWLSSIAADELVASDSSLESFSALLDAEGILLTSLNGFPYARFHENVVKEKVYLPHWGQRARLDYTLKLARLLSGLMPESCDEGTISTLPLAFARGWSVSDQQESEKYLCELILALTELEQSSGKRIRICLEMEPGCVIETTSQLIHFFTETLQTAVSDYGLPVDSIARYLGVCFDICHQAVMFENIEWSLAAIHRAGIVIGKIQISSALRLPNAAEARDLLVQYAEPRYLHQVSTLDRNGEQQFCVDLADALVNGQLPQDAEWRVHFHVPIQSEHLGSPLLSTTREAIVDTCRFLAAHPSLKPHLEVETYTWGMLPETLRPANESQLINAVAEELNWLQATLDSFALMST